MPAISRWPKRNNENPLRNRSGFFMVRRIELVYKSSVSKNSLSVIP